VPLCASEQAVLAKYAGLTVAEVKESISAWPRHAHQPGRRGVERRCRRGGLADLKDVTLKDYLLLAEIGMSSNALLARSRNTDTRDCRRACSGP